MLRENNSGSPEDWLRIARSDLAYARIPLPVGGMLSVPCFPAQQAVEKSLKGVLCYFEIDFPRTHNLDALAALLPPDIQFPFDRILIAAMTAYAAFSRYPGEYEEIVESDRDDAVRLAGNVVEWAEQIIAGQTTLL